MSSHKSATTRTTLNPFTILGLHLSCDDPTEVKAAYQSRLLRCKPDPSGKIFTKEFQLIQAGYSKILQIIDARHEKREKAPKRHYEESKVSMQSRHARESPLLNDTDVMYKEMHERLAGTSLLRNNKEDYSQKQHPYHEEPRHIQRFSQQQEPVPKHKSQVQLSTQQASQRFDAPCWDDPQYRKKHFAGDEIDPAAFERERGQRPVMDKYTYSDIPKPKPIVKGKTFDNNAFNVLFEMSKVRSMPKDALEREKEIVAMDPTENDSCIAPVVEHNGIMIVRHDLNHNTYNFSDYRKMEQEAETTVVLSVDDVSQDDINARIAQRRMTSNVVDTNSSIRMMKEYGNNKSSELPKPTTMTYADGKSLLLNRQMENVRKAENEAKAYVNQHIGIYPQFTREAYTRGALDSIRR